MLFIRKKSALIQPKSRLGNILKVDHLFVSVGDTREDFEVIWLFEQNPMFREFARSAELIKPKYIIGENVDGLLSRKTATGENYIDVIVEGLDMVEGSGEYERIEKNINSEAVRAERMPKVVAW